MGCDYIYVIVPNKQTIYPKMMPYGADKAPKESILDQITGYLERNGVDFINKSDDKIFVDQSVSKEQLLGIVQNLPNGYRMVFNMYVLDGMTHKEIAEDLSISENTSKSQLSKSKKMLRKLITEKYGAKVHNII